MKKLCLLLTFAFSICACQNEKVELPKKGALKTGFNFKNENIVSIPITKKKEIALENLSSFFKTYGHTQYQCLSAPIRDIQNSIFFTFSQEERSFYFRTFGRNLNDTTIEQKDYRIPLEFLSVRKIFKYPGDKECNMNGLSIVSKFNDNDFDLYSEIKSTNKNANEKIMRSNFSRTSEVDIFLQDSKLLDKLYDIFVEIIE